MLTIELKSETQQRIQLYRPFNSLVSLNLQHTDQTTSYAEVFVTSNTKVFQDYLGPVLQGKPPT